MKKFSEILRELRSQKGITLQQLAQSCGVSTRTMIRYEHGERLPDIETASIIANYLGVSISDLFETTSSPIEVTPSSVPEVQKLFDKLDPAEQAAVIQMMKTLIREKKNIPIEG